MKHRVSLSLALLVVIGACASTDGAQIDLARVTVEQWREDLRDFAKELPRRHANLYHTTPRDEFDRAVALLDRDIPTLAGHQIIVRMQQITAAVGDLHTYVQFPQTLPRYPVALYWFGNDLRVVRAAPAYKAALGGSVVAINGMSVAEVQRRVLSVLSRAENEWFILGASPGSIVQPAVLHTVGVIKELGPALFSLRMDDGREQAIEVSPVPWRPAVAAELIDAAAAEPLFRQRQQESFWFTYLTDSQTVYASFRGYEDLRDHVRKLFQLVDANPTRRLVLDLRQNAGGDYTKVRDFLIPAIRQRPAINTKGRLFVITGRRTLSAAMNSAADLRGETNAILVGEPPGERPNSYQEGDQLRLRHSRVVVSYSTRYYKFADEDIPAIMPDHRIDPAWTAYRDGRDAVMDWILSQPAGGQ